MSTYLLSYKLLTNPHKEADALCSQYHSTVSSLMDEHAPPHTKHVKAQHIPGRINERVIVYKAQAFVCMHLPQK